jgi:hypothetical protein
MRVNVNCVSVVVRTAVGVMLLFAVPTIARAQTCAGLYTAAEQTIAAYDRFDTHIGEAGSAAKARSDRRNIMASFYGYYAAFITDYEHDHYGSDDSDAIDSCDGTTRIAATKAMLVPLIMTRRMGFGDPELMLNDESALLDRLMKALIAENAHDPELATLLKYVKRDYMRSHLAMPPALLQVDAYVKSMRKSW